MLSRTLCVAPLFPAAAVQGDGGRPPLLHQGEHVVGDPLTTNHSSVLRSTDQSQLTLSEYIPVLILMVSGLLRIVDMDLMMFSRGLFLAISPDPIPFLQNSEARDGSHGHTCPGDLSTSM